MTPHPLLGFLCSRYPLSSHHNRLADLRIAQGSDVKTSGSELDEVSIPLQLFVAFLGQSHGRSIVAILNKQAV